MKANNFTLRSTAKNNYSLKNSIGNYVVLYFYPKDDTPGCTLETKDFNKLYTKFKKLDCEVFGISKDDIRDIIRSKIENVCLDFDLSMFT